MPVSYTHLDVYKRQALDGRGVYHDLGSKHAVDQQFESIAEWFAVNQNSIAFSLSYL